jgi:hypothetical protein
MERGVEMEINLTLILLEVGAGGIQHALKGVLRPSHVLRGSERAGEEISEPICVAPTYFAFNFHKRGSAARRRWGDQRLRSTSHTERERECVCDKGKGRETERETEI